MKLSSSARMLYERKKSGDDEKPVCEKNYFLSHCVHTFRKYVMKTTFAELMTPFTSDDAFAEMSGCLESKLN